jgi:protoporphyrinogen oxidase
MPTKSTIILGAGITGLAAGVKTGVPVYEANSYPGGICHSYTKKGYRFEYGGGRWIFGDDKTTLDFLHSLSPLKKYQRNSAVFFPKKNLLVPYPLQNHLTFLPKKIAKKALKEIAQNKDKKLSSAATFADWLKFNFGQALSNLFFFPFHQLYTASLYTKIAPQDKFKTPTSDKNSGYNKTFSYPGEGLSDLTKTMAQNCQVNYNKKVTKINTKKKEISFNDGTKFKYKKIISTLPLNKMVELAKILLDEHSPPYTSVLVINIGARKGRKCPPNHWLYFAKSKSGFYRVGFYNNIDLSFLPPSKKERVSLYVDKAYLGGKKPTEKAEKRLINNIVKELQELQFINQVEVVEPNWIEVAYTWSWPNSKWREKALTALEENDIYQIGRYGRWQFQGILESIKEGLSLPSSF